MFVRCNVSATVHTTTPKSTHEHMEVTTYTICHCITNIKCINFKATDVNFRACIK